MLPKDGYNVVISGVGGKFPETNNIAELQEKLFGKENLVTVDGRRWRPGMGNSPHASGKIIDEYKFDASFYGVHRRLCVSSEPMMKLTLERCYEAMFDAGVNPFTMRGRKIAVIVASINSESEILMLTHEGLVRDGFGILGHSQALLANRVSYFFNFVGPSFTINSSWTGGTTALEEAASLIRKGSVSAALVTSAYIMWSPSVSKEYTDIGLLTFDNQSSPFDANANGFIRSDGLVTYFLQRKEDANRIYASIVNIDSQCIGLKDCSFMKYDAGLGRFLSDFYKSSHCDPSTVAYVEPEALSIKDMDAAELNNIASVMCHNRESPLLIGSVKSNVGSAHVAASFMSVAKAIIAMETGLIPATLNYNTPNPGVPALLNGSLQPVTEHTALPGDLVAVNNLSISGTAGHILLRRHDRQKSWLSENQLPPDGLHRLVLFSARHKEGIEAVVNRILSVPLDTEFVSLVNNIHKTNIPNYLWRGYAISPSTALASNSDILHSDSEKQKPIWFVFSGMGSQWNGMGRELLQIPVFAAAVEKCDKVLRPLGVDVKHIITTEDPAVFDNILNCFVGIAVVQVGLVDILKVVGVQPDGIIGHSAGELGCAYMDGCFTAEQMVLSAYARGRASLDGDLCRGLMAAVGMGYQDIKDQLPASVDVACHNAANSCTISGPWDDVMEVVKQLKEKGVFVKAVNTSEKAFHSRYINPIAAQLNNLLNKVIPKPKARSPKWICTSVSKENWDTEEAQLASAKYYTNNLINPVLFEEGCAYIPKDAIVVEIAPHGLMQAILRRSLSPQCINIPLTNRTADSSLKHVLSALGKLYLNKVDLDINAMFPPVEYPVSRGTPSLVPLVTWDHTENWFSEFASVIRMMTEEKAELCKQIDENSEEYPLWTEHCIENDVVVPVAQLLLYPWNIVLQTKGLDLKQQAIEMEHVVITGRVVVDTLKQQLLDLAVFKGSQSFEVYLHKNEGHMIPCVTGVVSAIKRPQLLLETLNANSHTAIRVTQAQFYSLLSQHGHQLGPRFQAVLSLCVWDKDCEAMLAWTGDIVTFLDALFKLVVFLHLQSKQKIVEPNSFRRLVIDTPHFLELPAGSEILVRYNSKTNTLHCDGLRLEGLTLSSKDLKPVKSHSLNWKAVKYVPYNENIVKLEEFLNVSVQLVAEDGLNSWVNKVASFVTYEIREDMSKPFYISEHLQNILKALSHVSSRVQVKDLQKAREDLKQDSQKTYLLVGAYQTLLPLADSAQDLRNVFFLTIVPQNEKLADYNLLPVLTHRMNQAELVLLRKSTDTNKLRVFELDWMAGLRQFMSHHPEDQSVVIVSRHWHSRRVLKTLASETYARRFRCVFLDKQAPQFSLTSPLYHKQLTLGLSVNVLSGRVWGSYKTVDLPDVRSETDVLPNLDSSLKSLQISCIALNTRMFTLQPEVPSQQVVMKYVDYCGTRRGGERVMGVAKFDSKKVVPDQLLAWHVPSHWSSEEAVTVPYTYTMAYYCLWLCAKLERGESVLVHAGMSPLGQAAIAVSIDSGANLYVTVCNNAQAYYCLWLRAKLERGESVLVHAGMSPLGQAAIAVSIDSGANLYVTVCNNAQVATLIAAFPQIAPSHIIVLANSCFELKMKELTKNTGVNVIMNCLKGKEMNASLRTLGKFSRLIHLSDINIEDREEVGTFPFLRFNEMFGVSLDSIVNAGEEDKRKLRMFVDSGIKRGVVKPLKRKIFSLQYTMEALNNLRINNSIEKTVLVRHGVNSKGITGFSCDPSETFIIMGTKHGLWIDLAEWLLKNGARKIIIVTLKQNLTTNISRKFNSFMTQHHATIVMMSVTRLDSHRGAEELLQDAVTMGPLAGVFSTFMDENSAQLVNLDMAARLVVPGLKHFVCLLGGSTSVCEARKQLGLSACLIQSEAPLLRPQAILPYLSSVLCDNTSMGHTFLVSEQALTSEQKVVAASLEEVKKYLPSSLQELDTIGQYIPDHSQLQELTTLSARYEFRRYQLLPVFLIPALGWDRLHHLSRQLLHPAFCPSLPPCLPSVHDSAQRLLQQIVQVQEKGPYNVVGEWWSGAVALQLATLLEAKGEQVELILLDAAPATSQHWATALCHPSEGFSNASFLTVLLNLQRNVSKQLAELSSWEDQLHSSLQHVQAVSQDSVRKALSALRNHLTALLAFQPSEQLFQGNVHLLRCRGVSDSDYCDLKKYCKKKPTIHIMEDETLEEMLENPKTAVTINENLIFSWNL